MNLLPPLVAEVSGPGQERDRLEPFFLSRLDLLDRLVQLAGDHLHRELEPLVVGAGIAAGDDLDGVLLGEEALLVRCSHVLSRCSVIRWPSTVSRTASAFDSSLPRHATTWSGRMRTSVSS